MKHQICLKGGECECRADCVITPNSLYCSITGNVQDYEGNPIQGTCVKAITLEYEPIVHTITSGSGTFTLIVEQKECFFLVFSKEGYETLQLWDFTDEVCVCLTKRSMEGIVCGKVVYNHGKPAEFVRIKITNSAGNYCVFTKADGKFLCTGIRQGTYRLTISGNSCKEKNMHITIPEGRSNFSLGCITVQALDIMCTVHGIITDTDGKFIENAVVVLFNDITHQPVLHTLSNENGLYFFCGVEPGNYSVEVYY